MPYVNVKLAGSATKEEKKKIIEGVANLLHDVLGKPHSATYTVIDEVDTDNWGKGVETITELRAKA